MTANSIYPSENGYKSDLLARSLAQKTFGMAQQLQSILYVGLNVRFGWRIVTVLSVLDESSWFKSYEHLINYMLCSRPSLYSQSKCLSATNIKGGACDGNPIALQGVNSRRLLMIYLPRGLYRIGILIYLYYYISPQRVLLLFKEKYEPCEHLSIHSVRRVKLSKRSSGRKKWL